MFIPNDFDAQRPTVASPFPALAATISISRGLTRMRPSTSGSQFLAGTLQPLEPAGNCLSRRPAAPYFLTRERQETITEKRGKLTGLQAI
jgi:hypothetical protein